MSKATLSLEQRQRYFAILNNYKLFRNLSREEKEDLILRITSSEYIDLMCDWAFKHIFGHNTQILFSIGLHGIGILQYSAYLLMTTTIVGTWLFLRAYPKYKNTLN